MQESPRKYYHKKWGKLGLWFVLCAFWMSLLALCSPAPDDVDRYVLEIGSRKITFKQLKEDIKYLNSGLNLPEETNGRPNMSLIDRVIEYYLLQDYARNNGLMVPEEELNRVIREIKKDYPEDIFKQTLLETYTDFNEWKRHLRDRLISQKVFEEVTKSLPLPDLSEIKDYYKAHLDEYRVKEQVKFRQIVTDTKKDAQDLLARIKKGEDFSCLARQYSMAPEAVEGGLVGWISKGELDPSMDNVLFSLQVGKISPVVKTPYGYHIFLIVARRKAGIVPLKEVMNKIESELYETKREEYFKDWLSQLRSRANIKFNEKLFLEMKKTDA